MVRPARANAFCDWFCYAGDCDNDSECETGVSFLTSAHNILTFGILGPLDSSSALTDILRQLRCFKRDPGDTNSIPGCTGTLARDGTDYCYRVDGPQPTNAPVPLPTHAPVPQPTNAPVLVPQPTPAPTNPPTPAPMVPPTPTNPVPQPTMPPQPAGIPFLSRVSNDPTSDRFPLGKCLGECLRRGVTFCVELFL